MGKYTYGFANQLGIVYKTGNLVFTPDGNALLSAVGNRVSVFDLVGHSSFTLDFETRSDISRMAMSPDGRILLVVDVDGYAVAANFHRRVILHRFNFKEQVRDISFSPDGKFFAVALGKKMQVWRTPGLEREFSAFVLHRTYTGHFAAVNCVSWSKNSLYLVTGSKDYSCKVYSLHPIPGYIPVTLSGHRDEVVSASFAEEDVIYSVAADGGTFVWAWKPRPEIAEATIERIAKKQRMAERLQLKGTGDDAGDALDNNDDGDDDNDDSEGNDEEEEESGGLAEAKRRRKAGASSSSSSSSAAAASGAKRRRPSNEEDDAEEGEGEDNDEGRAEGQEGDEGQEEELDEEELKALRMEGERNKRGLSSKGTVAALTAREGGRGKSVKSATDVLATRRPHVVPAPFADATKTAAALQPKAGAAKPEGAEGDGEEELDEDAAVLAEAADGDKREAARIGVRLSVTHGEWTLSAKHLLRTNRAKVQTATVHAASGLLVLGLSSGVFSLFTMPDGQQVHSLSVSSHQIHASAINASGDWLAFGSSTLGQLLVWEWKTETYILKQQGHFHDLNAVAFSPNGQLAATGGDDGKLKIWNTATGFCFVTFSEHTAPITAVTFMGGKGTGHGLAVVSASLDGTVRAFDLVRYRNFRTFTAAPGSPPVQFTCLAVDEGGELVMAAGMEPFGIHVWSVHTGKLLDVLSGHEGPVSALSYSTASGLLASCSWDKTAKLWDLYGDGAATETLKHNSDALAVAFRPDGAQLAVSTLDGILHFWDAKKGVEVGTIDSRRDAAGGRKVTDATKLASSSTAAKCFTSIAYTADGECLLAGGRSKYACLYAIAPKLLLRKWQISHNRSLDGILDKLSGKDLGEAGNTALLDLDDAEDPDKRRMTDVSLPGAKKGDMASKRNLRQEVRAKAICFSPTGRAFAIATTEGLLLYSLDEALVFDPFELGEDVNPEACSEALEEGQFVKALLIALHLNEGWLIVKVVEALPVQALALLFSFVPTPFLARLLDILASKLHPNGASRSPHVEFYLRALLALLTAHAKKIRDRPTTFAGALRSAQRALVSQREALSKMIDSNAFTLAFLAEGFGGITAEATAAKKLGSEKGEGTTKKAAAAAAPVEELDEDGGAEDEEEEGGWIVPSSSSSSSSSFSSSSSSSSSSSAAAAAGAGKAAVKAANKAANKSKGKQADDDGHDEDDDEEPAYKQPAVKAMVSRDYEELPSNKKTGKGGSSSSAAASASASAPPPAKRAKTDESAPSAAPAKKAAAASAGGKKGGGK